MNRRTKLLAGSAIALLGAVGFLALTVYPFQYGPVESAALVGVFVAAALWEAVLEDTSF